MPQTAPTSVRQLKTQYGNVRKLVEAALEESGVISSYHARLSEEALGLGITEFKKGLKGEELTDPNATIEDKRRDET